jgi:hypothetical protein
MAANIPSTSALPDDFQASVLAENHQTSPSNLLPNPLVANHHDTFIDSFANSLPINPSRPLFLHSGDNPRIILVPQPLTGENYNTWSCSMLVALSAKNIM